MAKKKKLFLSLYIDAQTLAALRKKAHSESRSISGQAVHIIKQVLRGDKP